jgi:hypothetical protein
MQSIVERCGDSGRIVTGYPAAKQKRLDGWQSKGVVLHDVMPASAVNVEIYEPGGKGCIAQVHMTYSLGQRTFTARGNFCDCAVTEHNDGIQDLV